MREKEESSKLVSDDAVEPTTTGASSSLSLRRRQRRRKSTPAKTVSVVGFVIDATSHRPVEAVTSRLVALDERGEREDIAVATTDPKGFVGFEVAPAAIENKKLLIALPGGTELPVRARQEGDATPAGAPDFIARVDPSIARDSVFAARGRYAPRMANWSASPLSYARVPSLTLGQGHCEVPVPSAVTPAEIRFYQIVRRPLKSGPNTRRSSPAPAQPSFLDVVAPLATPGVPRLLFGERLVYKQVWTLIGQSLGDLSYSLPLAPLESVNVAVVDWSRTEAAARAESTTLAEQLVHDLKRDRTILETVDVALSEYQGGFSVLGGVGGAAPGVAGGIGAGTSHSWGTRDLTGQSTQDLADSISQASEVVRTQNSTVVIQATQHERDAVQTRTVSNYNQTRAMTVQYYEVLRHFSVTTRFVEAHPVLLIPFAPVRFDRETAKRFRHVLVPHLLDRRKASWFDSLEYDSRSAGEARDEQDRTATESESTPADKVYRIERLQVDLETGDQETAGYVEVLLGLRDGTWVLAMDIPSRGFGVEIILQKNSTYTSDVREGEAVGIDARDVEQVRVRWTQNGLFDGWKFRGITVRYAIEGTSGLQSTPLFSASDPDSLKHFVDRGRKSWTSELFRVEPPAPSARGAGAARSAGSGGPDPAMTPNRGAALAALDTAARLDTRLRNVIDRVKAGFGRGNHAGGSSYAEHARKQKLLLEHLNAHRFHYSRWVWLGQDPDERVAMLTSNPWLREQGVLDNIDFEPVGVSGSYVAFRYFGPNMMEMPEVASDATSDTRVVSLPSRGVFAEIHLSHCSAREERDPARMYGPGEIIEPSAPPITGVQPGSRHAPIDTQPTGLPAPVVNIQNVPAAPEFGGLGSALDMIGRGDVFRDMSTSREVSSLLGGIISGAISGDAAKTAANQVRSALARGAAGSTTDGLPHPATTGNARDLYDRLHLLEQSDLPPAEKARIRQNLIDPGPAPSLSADGVQLAGLAGGRGAHRVARSSRVIKEGDGVADAVVFYLHNPVFDQPVQNRFGQILSMSTGDFFGERLILWPRASDIWYLEGDRILSDRPDQFFSLLEFEAVLDKIDRMGWLFTMAEVEMNFLIAFTVPLWAIVFAKGAGVLAQAGDPNLRRAIVGHGPKVVAGLQFLRDNAGGCLGCIVKNSAVEALKGIPSGLQARDLAYLVGRVLFSARIALARDTLAVALHPLREIAKANRLTIPIVASLRASGAAASQFTSRAQALLADLQAEGIPVEGSVPCVKDCLEELVNVPTAETELRQLADSIEAFVPALEALLGPALDPGIDL